MSQRILRWGILGTARIADSVLRGIRMSSNSEATAVASRDAARARAWAGERGIGRVFDSYSQLVESSEIDAVYIPLPNGLHKEWSINAARNGKHVLCEKPLAPTAAEAHEMVVEAEKNGVRLMEAFMYRFHPQTALVRRLATSGATGDLKIIRGTFCFLLDRPDDVRWSASLSGGALMDVGCYCAGFARLVTGENPVAVTALATWGPTGVDTSLVGTLEFPSGALGAIDCSLVTGPAEQRFEVSGPGGRILVTEPFSIGENATTVRLIKGPAPDQVQEITVPAVNHYHLMVEHFAEAVLNGGPLDYSLEDTLGNMRTLDALREAARSGVRVVVQS